MAADFSASQRGDQARNTRTAITDRLCGLEATRQPRAVETEMSSIVPETSSMSVPVPGPVPVHRYSTSMPLRRREPVPRARQN